MVDEAHCVYQWGVDFRPEYSKLDLVQKQLDFPLTLALTATATPVVQHAIIKQLFSHGISRSSFFSESKKYWLVREGNVRKRRSVTRLLI